MHDRELLLKRVQVCDFALNDAALFLDTHPNDQDALAFFKKHTAYKKKACEDYECKYGPLTVDDYDGGCHWAWIDGPWPWQRREA